jgi:hypothetical protein
MFEWYLTQGYDAEWAFDMMMDHFDATGCWGSRVDQWNEYLFTTYTCGTCGDRLD